MEHQNFILCSPLLLNQYLADSEFWQVFIAHLMQIVPNIREAPSIKAYQHSQHIDWAWNSDYEIIQENEELGRIRKQLPLSWQAEELEKIADVYRQDKNAHLDFLGAVFPHFSKCIAQKATPECVFLLSEDFPKFSSLLISLRQDYFAGLGEVFVLDILNQLSQQLDVSLRLRKQRRYGHLIYKKCGYGHFADVESASSWQDSIQQFGAYMVADYLNNEWHIDKRFADWTVF
ncbi:hypothetical protein V6667_05935 [Neisseria leonii]|uniref:hypothetical protein n=1 Tax=Neisseria leonii TaxID=2995413 RepID=UPI0030CA6FEF